MIYTEITPNPASLKFVVDRNLIKNGESADCPSPEETVNVPVAKKLFDFKFVERVFVGANFITITKNPAFQWEEIIPIVKDFLKAFFDSGQEAVTGDYTEAPVRQEIDESDVTQRIKALLASHVRPAVASDGGDIIYDDFVDGILKLRLQGSCSGCPSSTLTLKNGIEGLMTRMIPEVKSVEAI
ncbi:MAG: NifU family protein [Bacteroidota bacterium]